MPKCKICGKDLKWINRSHLAVHGLTNKEYCTLYPDAPIYDDDVIDRRKQAIKDHWVRIGGNVATSERLRKQWQDPEYRAHMTQVSKDNWKNPEYRDKHARMMEGKWMDPEFRKKHLAGLERTKEQRSASLKKRWQDPEFRKRFGEAMAKVRSGERLTSLEEILYSVLDSCGVAYDIQVPIDKFIADALVEGWLVVEADGDYWHSKPEIRATDRRKDGYLVSRGYQVLRFWGHELKESPDMCADRLTYVMDCT